MDIAMFHEIIKMSYILIANQNVSMEEVKQTYIYSSENNVCFGYLCPLNL